MEHSKFTVVWENITTEAMNIVSYIIWQLEEHHKFVYALLALAFVVLIIIDAKPLWVQRNNTQKVEEDVMASGSGRPDAKLICQKNR